MSQRPMTSRPIQDTEDLISHLMPMLQKYLANDVSRVYFGDIGVYLPSHFLGPRKENKAVLIIAPAYDRVQQRVAGRETRLIGVNIIALVNITPYFQASPQEAYGERQLAVLMKKIRTFLTQQEHVQLGGRVQYFSVGDVSWRWMQRDKLSLRGAALEVEATISVSRMQNL